MSKGIWIGVDLGWETFEGAVVAEEAKRWSKLPTKRFENTSSGVEAFYKWTGAVVGDEPIQGFCMEATGALAYRFVDALNDRLGPISLVNPRYISDYGKSLGLRDKTDRIDACVAALYGQAHGPMARPMPPKNLRALRELLALYEAAQADVLAWKNRLGKVSLPTGVRRQTRSMLAQLANLMDELEAQMDTLIENDAQLREDAKRLQTIPGVAKKTARLVLAQFGDLRTYKRNEIVALAGLYPTQFQSGKSVRRRPRIAKSGNRRLRKGLYFPAIVAKKYCPPLQRTAQRLQKKGLAPKAIIIAIMRKLLLLMRALIVNQTDFKTT